jgi:hypothetical protein
MKALRTVIVALLVGTATVMANDPQYVMRVGDKLITQAEMDAWYTSARKRVCVHAGSAILGRLLSELWITGRIVQVYANDSMVIVDKGHESVAVRVKSFEGLRTGDQIEVWCMLQNEMYRYVTATGKILDVRRYLNVSAALDPDTFLANCWQPFILDLLPTPQHAYPASVLPARSRATDESHVTLLRPVKPRCMQPHAASAP